MQVPLVDLAAQYREIRDEIARAMQAVLDHNSFIFGPEVQAFERAFADYCSCPHAVGVASGVDALKLALRAAGLGPGDEVILPANTFIATALAVSEVGAAPVLADMEPDYFNVDTNRVREALTDRTRAIVAVHLFGQPADTDPLEELAERHCLFLLEDAAQAHGARYKGRRAGSLGNAAGFSFYPGKNLGAYGDGGLVTTRDERLARQVALLRNYGSEKKYHHDIAGGNSRLDTLQAAILLVKLKHLDDWNRARRRAAAMYTERLTGVGDVQTPRTHPQVEHIFHLYVIRTARRDALMTWLRERGIGCQIHYPIPIHRQKAYEHQGWKQGQFPETERAAAEILSLPISPHLTDEQLDYVTDSVRSFFAG